VEILLSVLYVDDEPSLLTLAKTYLEKRGDFKIETITSAQSALELLHSGSFDAIVSDYQMPEIDGIGFLKKVRASFGEVPFILFTGKGREDVVIEAIDNGVDFYLQKGGDPKSQFAELSHKIRKAVDQRQAEKALKNSEQRLSDIINFLPDATFAINLEGKVIAWNQAMEEMTGINKNAMLMKGNYEYALPFYSERRPMLLDLVLHDEEKIREKYQSIQHQDTKLIAQLFIQNLFGGKGAYLWFAASPLYDTKGMVIGAIESIRDITEQKKIEQKLAKRQHELQKSEERYKNVVEDQTEFISRFLPDGTHVFVNEAYCRYFGKSRKEIIGHIFKPDIPKEDRIKLREHMALLTPVEPVGMVEHRIMMPDGRECWQRWSDRAIFDDTETILEYQSVGRDITDVKTAELKLNHRNEELFAAYEQIAAAEEELRSNYDELAKNQELLQKTEERYRNVVEDQTEFISRFLPDGTHVFVNEAYCRYFGKSREDIIGHIFRPDIPKEDRIKLREHLSLLSPDQPVSMVEHRIIMPDGRECWQRWSDRAIFDESGSIIEYQSVGRDVTDMKTAELELNRRNEELFAAYEQIAATEEELRSNYDELAKNQELLQKTEERYRNVVEDQTEFISRFLPDGTHVFVNEAYCRYFGKSREDIIGHIFRPDIPKEDRIKLREHLTSLSPDQPVAMVEHRIIMPDGRECWQRWSDRAIFDESGSIIEYQSVGRDVTDMKTAELELNRRHEELAAAYEQIAAVEEELRGNYDELSKNQALLQKSEEKYQTLTENIPGIVYRAFVKQRTQMQFFNQMLEKFTGYTPSELTHGDICSIESLIHPDDRARVIETVKDAIRRHHLFEVEYRMIVKDGSTRYFMERGRPVFDARGNLECIDGIINDITERKQMEEALRDSEIKYSDLVRNANSIILKWDKSGNITFFNEFAQQFFGYTDDEILGKPLVGTIVPATESGSQRDLSALIDDIIRNPQDHFHNENENIRKDGERVWIHWHNKPLLDENGNFIGLFSIGADITERKRAEDIMRQANKKLKLLSHITRHDINNQLTVLMGYIEILRSQQSDPEQNTYFRKAMAAADRISSMIRFTREYEEVGVKAPVWEDCRTIVDTAASEARHGTVRVENDLPAGIEVFADPLITRVFYNLVDNAVRHGGKIRAIRYSIENRNDKRIIVCEDDGCGIPVIEKEHIFDPGFGKNTGLGLALSREVLSITGITITETGKPEKGARFEIAVPKEMWRINPGY